MANPDVSPDELLTTQIEEIASTKPAHPLKPDIGVMLLTWITFFLLLAVLKKFAWKPILDGIDRREAALKAAVEQAETTRREYEQLEKTRRRKISEAKAEAREIVGQARKDAVTAGRVIEQRARDEAQIIMENTRRDLKAEQDKSADAVRRAGAEVAVRFAEKIVRENLDDKKNKDLIERMLKNV